jgi:hypothetical protein
LMYICCVCCQVEASAMSCILSNTTSQILIRTSYIGKSVSWTRSHIHPYVLKVTDHPVHSDPWSSFLEFKSLL